MGEAIARVMLRRAGGVAIIASSDLSHYHDQKAALRLDERAIDRILALDPAGLHERIEAEDISMCGICR